MRAEFYREDAPDQVVGRASWTGSGAHFEAADERTGSKLGRIFRSLPVIVDDPSLRAYGTSGPVQLSPGSLIWFRAAAAVRGKAEGLGVRLVAGEGGPLGWDPAGTYRPLASQVERRERAAAPGVDAPAPGPS